MEIYLIQNENVWLQLSRGPCRLTSGQREEVSPLQVALDTT